MKKFALVFIVIFACALALCACDGAYKLSFSSEEYVVGTGTCFTPQVNIKPKKEAFTISVANGTVAKVEDNVITALKEGITKLYVSSGDMTDECTLIVQDEVKNGSSDIILKNSYVVSLEVVNYELAGLATGKLQNVFAVEGSFISVSDPNIYGYISDCWYTDRECTQKFDTSTRIYADMTLYARLTERETTFNIVNGFVTGLTYPNLEHKEIVLPERETGGAEVLGVADEAFKGDETIEKVVFPSSYRSIGTSAFAGCVNLTEVVIPEDSDLHTIGASAFGPVLNDKNEMENPCEKLRIFNLPDGVAEIGSFAFYGCKELSFDGIPSSLAYVEQYAFAYTGINNVDLKNINSLYEGAFFNCEKFDTVSGTENVSRCDKLVFKGTKLEADGIKKYTEAPIKDKKDDDAAIYVGTILFGCYSAFGKSVGSGKLHIKNDTTLIADEAFNNAAQSELTLYIDTETAAAALNRNFIGRNVFYKSEGVFVVVGKNSVAGYRERYDNDDRNYADLFVEEEIITVVGDDNADVVNWGKHVLLKKPVSGGYRYYYDKFIPFEKGSPRIIRLSRLGANINVHRINMNAFNSIDELMTLELYRVRTIAYYGVANCKNLTRIDLTNTVSPTELESAQSIQVSSLPNAKIYVKVADLLIYRSQWASFGALNRLVGE